MLATIDTDKLTESEVEDTIQFLEEAQQILYTHGWATKEGKGHNDNAITLKEEIDRLIEELRQRQNNPQETNTAPDKSEEERKQDQKEKEDIKNQLQERQKQSNQERNEKLSEIEQLENFEFYQGINW